jgi:hypothetical protein
MSPYYKELCNMIILTKTKVLKPREIPKIDERKSSSKSILKSILPVRPVLHISQTGLTCPRARPDHQTCPVPLPDSRGVFQTCLMNNMTVGI